jgi:hypothetical protein
MIQTPVPDSFYGGGHIMEVALVVVVMMGAAERLDTVNNH